MTGVQTCALPIFLNPADLLPFQFFHIDNDRAAAAPHGLCQVSVGNRHLPSSAVRAQAKTDEEPESSIGKQIESAGNFPSRDKPSAGVLQLSTQVPPNTSVRAPTLPSASFNILPISSGLRRPSAPRSMRSTKIISAALTTFVGVGRAGEVVWQ